MIYNVYIVILSNIPVSNKPIKKSDKELFSLIDEKIAQKQYVFLLHSDQRMRERKISELDVINLLSGKKGYGRKRNKKKDIYEPFSICETSQDWKYCIEGRVIVESGVWAK